MTDRKFKAAGIFGRVAVTGLFSTVRSKRIRSHHYQDLRRDGKRVIFVFWHGTLLPLVHHHRKEGICVLVSEHADGEYVAQILARNGFGLARGSSTRGGSTGLRQLVRAAKKGHDLGITPDGPKGPPRVFKAGALVASRLTGLPMVPIAVGTSSAWRLNSWDRFIVPKPFSRLRLVYGEPVYVPRDADDDAMASLASEMQERLERLNDEAQQRADRTIDLPEDQPL